LPWKKWVKREYWQREVSNLLWTSDKYSLSWIVPFWSTCTMLSRTERTSTWLWTCSAEVISDTTSVDIANSMKKPLVSNHFHIQLLPELWIYHFQIINFFFYLHRIFCRVSSSRTRSMSRKKHHPQRHQARELGHWWRRISKNHWFRYCENMETWKRLRHFRNSRIHGTWGNV